MTKFINWNHYDDQWKLDDIVEVVNLVKKYCDNHGYKNVRLSAVLTELDDKNDRKNVRIHYTDEHNNLVSQLLLIINGEIMDGDEFHERIKEFYPDKAV